MLQEHFKQATCAKTQLAHNLEPWILLRDYGLLTFANVWRRPTKAIEYLLLVLVLWHFYLIANSHRLFQNIVCAQRRSFSSVFLFSYLNLFASHFLCRELSAKSHPSLFRFVNGQLELLWSPFRVCCRN